MIRLQDLYSFIEGNFDFLLVVDGHEKVLHASPLLCSTCGQAESALADQVLEDMLMPDSLEDIRSGMVYAKEGTRRIVLYVPKGDKNCRIPLKTGYADTTGGRVYLFFGNTIDGLSKYGESEKDERIKELSCLYSVGEWIEISSTIQEFFSRLPDYISRGMQFPEQTVVYSNYQGVEYGQKPPGRKHISANLVVSGQPSGEIVVGYISDEYDLLPEEQKMIDEIGWILSLALERRHLEERMALKQEEEAEYSKRFAELEKEIESRTKELNEQRQKLSTVNDYLSRTNRDWEETSTRLETIFKAIPDDVALIDKHRTVIMTNHKHVEPGGKCYRSFFKRDVPCENCRLSTILRDKTPITLTIKDEDRYLEVHALPVFNQEHEVNGIIEFYRDISLEKTYEQQLQQADKLASLGQLVSGIGHEINNPNQFIKGNIKIVKQAIEDMLPIVDAHYQEHPDLKIARLKYDFFREHIMTLVDDMGHGSQRIKGIVEGLKRFARRDEGLLIDTVDVNTLIEAGARLVHNEVHKRADIKLELAPDVPAFTGNSQKIEQVLINLLVNASHAMPDDRKGLITVSTRTEDASIVIRVKDNGQGMNEKTLKQIFDPFFTTKRAKGGTGLGLAIAYRIIEEHRGKISVTSKPGVGTTFEIRIPSETVAPPGKPEAPIER